MKRRSGFTLIELMIVLAIIAALAAILTPMGLNALNRAKATQVVADIRNIKAAEQVYYFDKNTVVELSGLNSGYLNTDELTLGAGAYSVTVDASNAFTVKATSTTGIVEQFMLAWSDGSATDNSAGSNIELEFAF